MKNKIFRKAACILLVSAMALSVTACGKSSKQAATASSSQPKVSDTLKVALNADPPTLDPLMTTGAITRDCVRYIYEGLFEMNDKMEAKPQLCTDYTTNADFTQYTFNLRKNVTFHDGQKMTADDVVASLNRWLSLNSAVKSYISHGEKFEKVDDYTVTIKLQSPCYLLPGLMTAPAQFPVIMPKKVVDEASSTTGITEYIGTGPMKFVEWKQNQYLLLTKYDGYVGPGYKLAGDAGDKTMYFKNMYLYFVPDSTIRSAGIKTGEYDIASNVSYDDIPELKTNKNITLNKSLMGYSAIIMNKKEGTLSNNVKLRQAVTIGLNNNEIMQAAYPNKDYFDVTGSMMPKGSQWYSTIGTSNINVKNTAEAKKLVSESGYDGTPLKVITDQTYPQHYNATLVLVDQLKKLGLQVNLTVVDWTTLLTYKKTPSKYDLYFMDYPAVAVPVSLRTISTTDEGWTLWPDFLSLLGKVNTATSAKDAQGDWQACQKYLMDNFSYVPLGYTYYCNATSSKIKGYSSFLGQSVLNCYKAG